MKSVMMLWCSLCVLGLSPAVAQDDADAWIKKSFVIVYASKDYRQALTVARDAQRRTGLALNLRGLTPHSQSHLTFAKSECARNEVEYPCYLTRAYEADGVYLTIDWSAGFEDFQPGYFIVTAVGADPGAPVLAATLQRVKKLFPDAYIKTTRVYVGCMH